MDIQLKIQTDEEVITPVCDFTYSWCLSYGIDEEEATKFTIAVSELISNIILFANPHSPYTDIELTFRNSLENIEVIIRESGEPFDPDRHRYNSEHAIENGDFEGAGLRIVKNFSDEFLFLNKGKEGKEFRLFKKIEVKDIDEIMERSRSVGPPENAKPKASKTTAKQFHYSKINPSDAEDIAKLIYRTYEYSYSKEELYYPNKIEEAVLGKEKLGVICRNGKGTAVGYFAVLKKDSSNIAEVGEAVVSPEYRRLGIMSKILELLINLSKRKNISALFGKAVTIHPVSQRVNYKFDFKTTALMLGETKKVIYKGFDEKYPQPISVVIDFLPLGSAEKKKIYPPVTYQDILLETYGELEWDVYFGEHENPKMAKASDIDLEIDYTEATALLVVKKYGPDFRLVLMEMLESLYDQEDLNIVYVDLPLQNSATPAEFNIFPELGFIYCGLAPMFHENKDYLRLQKVNTPLNIEIVDVYSDFGKKIKSLIADEYSKLA